MTTTPTRSAPSASTRALRVRPRHVLLGILGLLLVALVSVGLSPIGERFRENADDAPPVTGVETVELADSRFVQASIAVPVGTTVTWDWTDGEEHDVVFTDGPASAVVGSGTWERTFDEPGEYRYSCTLHPFMDGRVVVEG